MNVIYAWLCYLTIVLGLRSIIGESFLGYLALRFPLALLLSRPFPTKYHARGTIARGVLSVLQCPSCVGFWVGVGFRWLLPIPIYGLERAVVSGLLTMFAARTLAALLHPVTLPFESDAESMTTLRLFDLFGVEKYGEIEGDAGLEIDAEFEGDDSSDAPAPSEENETHDETTTEEASLRNG